MDTYTLTVFGMLLAAIGIFGSILTPVVVKDPYTQVFIWLLGAFFTILGSLGMIISTLREKRYQAERERWYEEERRMEAKGWDSRRRAVERFLSKRWVDE